MKHLFLFIVLFSIAILSSCNDEDMDFRDFKIEGLTMENYPIVDCSTSTSPLSTVIASRLLGYDYRWEQALHMNGAWYILTELPYEFYEEHLKVSQTHNSFINLIDNKVDITLSARKMSDDEKEYAEKAGVTLIETPVALDAFIFVTNKSNPVKSLTITQAQDIYTGKIRNWKDVGGNDNTINPYIRNANSGSQELMESLVMKNLQFAEWPEDFEPELPSMMGVFSTIRTDVNGLGYTVYYYKEYIVRDDVVNSLSINGVYPDKKTISSGKYPLIAEVYAVIRSDLDKSSMAYKLYELLQTKSSRRVIEDSGFTPYN